jgi:hypothetical protein
MEGADALLAGVGLEVPHDHLFDEQPRDSGSPLRRTRTIRHQLVLRFHPHFCSLKTPRVSGSTRNGIRMLRNKIKRKAP